MKKICPNCGVENEENAKFCMNCAAKLSEEITENIPDVEEAEANVKKYIRRIKNRRNRLGIEAPLKYIIVTEYRTKEDGSPTRIHHHIIMDGAMDRDEISELWRDRRKKGEKQ